jgi:hypothetical protein
MASFVSTAGLARASDRRPWLVVATWALALVLSAAAAAFWLGDALTSEVNFTNSPESIRGHDLLEARMPAQADPISETVIVRSQTATVGDPAFRAVVEAATADLRSVDGVTAVNLYEAQAAGDPGAAGLVSADRRATLIPATFAGPLDDAAGRLDPFVEALASHRSSDYQLLTVGDLSIDEEFNGIAEADLQTAEIVGPRSPSSSSSSSSAPSSPPACRWCWPSSRSSSPSA